MLSKRVLPKQRVVLAYSGGLDSTVACHVLASLRDLLDIQLSAVHINHGLSIHADDWSAQCRLFADSLDVPLSAIRVRVSADSGDGLEQAARRARYAELDTQDADWILLAHHSDDQAETILHNLARGTGVLGLAGMPECRGRYLRPLLTVSRAMLEAYALRHRLKWIDDESNADLRFTRNYWRREVLPVIRMRFPDFALKSAMAGRRVGEAQRLLNDLAEIDAAGHRLEFPFSSDPFQVLSEQRSANLFRVLLAKYEFQSPPELRVKEFVAQLAKAGPDRHPEIRLKTHVIRRVRGMLHLNQIEPSATGK